MLKTKSSNKQLKSGKCFGRFNGLSATIFCSCLTKGFSLQSLTQHTASIQNYVSNVIPAEAGISRKSSTASSFRTSLRGEISINFYSMVRVTYTGVSFVCGLWRANLCHIIPISTVISKLQTKEKKQKHSRSCEAENFDQCEEIRRKNYVLAVITSIPRLLFFKISESCVTILIFLCFAKTT
jgi:hypothetical protein